MIVNVQNNPQMNIIININVAILLKLQKVKWKKKIGKC